MQDEPLRYWQDLTENYRQMSDGELLELAEKPQDLTDVAQQVLRDEMKLRTLDKPQPRTATVGMTSVLRKNYDILAGPLADSYVVPSDPDDQGTDNDEGGACAYTWKVRLCECSDTQEANQLSEALERAGIESWVEAMPPYAIGVGSPRILVPADRLEEARAIAERPIPQDIIEKSKVEVPEFVVPVCPECGAHDPLLESIDPVNAWVCEACGAEWSDPEPPADSDPEQKSSVP